MAIEIMRYYTKLGIHLSHVQLPIQKNMDSLVPIAYMNSNSKTQDPS